MNVSDILALSGSVRYAAIYHRGVLTSLQRDSLSHASAAESDRYEEWLVNPTLITLLTQRGNIDCGGFESVLVRYGYFVQFVLPYAEGHVSVCIDQDADIRSITQAITALVHRSTFSTACRHHCR